MSIRTFGDVLASFGIAAWPLFFCPPLAFVIFSLPELATAEQLLPQTKMKLTIVQWVPTKGAYEPWEGISGEYTISDMNTVSIPVLGTLAIENNDSGGLATTIAERLRTKLGLVAAPEATVEIISYPPIYVVGDVTKPGEYQYRTGLTVLQAFATSGGAMRSENAANSSIEVTRLMGEIKASDDSILRSSVRSVRLEAEMSNATELHFSQVVDDPNEFTAAIVDQEKVIFDARKKALEQQAKSLTELSDFLQKEINALEGKLGIIDANIKSRETALASVAQLVTRGAVTVSRQMDTERDLREDQGQRLEMETAIMRARQEFSRASRDLQALYDGRKTDSAAALQAERASMAQERLKRETNQKLLLETLSANPTVATAEEAPVVTFRILRRENGKLSDFLAPDTTTLMPGDVVKVARIVPQGGKTTSRGYVIKEPGAPTAPSQIKASE